MIIKELFERVMMKTGLAHLRDYYRADANVLFPTKENRIFFLMTPTYGNLGDQAIEVATERFLLDYFKKYTVIKIHLEDTYKTLKKINSTIKDEDFVVLQGGGNFGDLYHDVEDARRFIVQHIKSRKIISMPVTVYYRNEKQLRCSSDIYNHKSGMYIFTREKFSWEFAKEHFTNCNVELIPDIVFYLNEIEVNEKRKGILICLRHDTESVLGNKRAEVIKELYNKHDDLEIIDTQLYRKIDDALKDIEVRQILEQFRNSELVITDRLHGLIFSAITHTPCIVMPSLDKKIIGTYQWLKDYTNICYLEEVSFDKLENLIASYRGKKNLKPIDFKANFFEHFAQYIAECFNMEIDK